MLGMLRRNEAGADAERKDEAENMKAEERKMKKHEWNRCKGKQETESGKSEGGEKGGL